MREAERVRRALDLGSVGPDARLLAVLCVAAAALTILLVLLAGGEARLEPGELLPYFQAHRARYVLSAAVTLAWVLVSVPPVAVLKGLLGADRPALASSAAMLAVGGILLLGFGLFMAVGSFFALDWASGGIAARLQSPYQAAIWRNIGFLMTDPGLMTLGGGQLLFACLAFRTTLSRWIVIVGFLGGVAGLLTLAVYQSAILAIPQLAALAVWDAAIGMALMTQRHRQ